MSVTEPTPESAGSAPPAGERAPWAWVLLGTLFVLLATLQAEGGPKGHGKVNAAVLLPQLKGAFVQREAPRFMAFAAEPSAKTLADADAKSRTELSLLYKKAIPSEPAGARISLVVGRELGMPPDKVALATLSSSSSRRNKVFAEIYSAPRLDSGWLARNGSLLPDNFLGRVARAHAADKADPSRRHKPLRLSDVLATTLLGFGLMAGILCGLGVLFFGIVALALARVKPVGYPVGHQTKAQGDRLALRMTVALVVMFSVPSLVGWALGPRVDPTAADLVGVLVVLASYAWLYRRPLLGAADPLPRLLGATRQVGRLVGVGVLGFFALIPVTLLLFLATSALFKGGPEPTHPLAERLAAGDGPVTVVCFYFLAAVMAPVLEELTFRGTLFPAIGAYARPWVAMALSGLLFGAIHPQGPALWIPLGMVGATSALLAYLTGSLVPCMVMHSLYNTALFCGSLVLLF